MSDLSVTAAIEARIREEHEAAQRAARTALDHAIRCGQLLAEAKSQLPHGAWGNWLAEHFPASPRTARGYMRLAEHREELNRQGLADLGIEGALRQLAAPREPEAHWMLRLIPPMSDAERAGLLGSIREHGCLVAIELDEDGTLLDGRERWRACHELGIKPPTITRRGFTDDQKADHVLSLNLLVGDRSPERFERFLDERLLAAGDDPAAVRSLIDDLDFAAPIAIRQHLKAKRRYGELLSELDAELRPAEAAP